MQNHKRDSFLSLVKVHLHLRQKLPYFAVHCDFKLEFWQEENLGNGTAHFLYCRLGMSEIAIQEKMNGTEWDGME